MPGTENSSSEMHFESPGAENAAPTETTAPAKGKTKPAPKKDAKKDGKKPAQPAAAPLEEIHAKQCVVNSECVFTPGCRGRLKTTNPIGGNVQVYCPKCQRFAVGTRPSNGMVTAGVRTFDRTAAKVTDED